MIILKKVILGTILGATLVAGTVLSPALPAEQVTQVSAAAKYKAGVTITKDSAKVKKLMASNKKKTGNSYTVNNASKFSDNIGIKFPIIELSS